MIYSPMHKGLLSGKYTGEETFDDFRMNHPDFQGDRFRELCAKVQSLKPIAERNDLTIYQLALSATLMHPAIHVAVCGIKTPDQIAEAVGAAGKCLSREDYFTVRNTVGRAARKFRTLAAAESERAGEAECRPIRRVMRGLSLPDRRYLDTSMQTGPLAICPGSLASIFLPVRTPSGGSSMQTSAS